MLWLDSSVTIMVDLIADITGLPKDGPDPLQYFRGKDNDKRLAARLEKKYGLRHNGWDFRIDSINDHAMHISARILASKIVGKNFPIQSNLGLIACAEQCAEGLQMN